MIRYAAVHVIALFLGVAHASLAFGGQVEYSLQTPGASRSMLLDIAVAGERLVAVGERGHILTSQDQGQNWTQAEVPTSVMLTRVFFVDDKLGWAVGHDGNVLHSQDGGLIWALQRDGLADQVRINEDNAGRALSTVEELQAQLAAAEEDAVDALEEALEEAEWVLENAREKLDMPVYAPPLMDVWFATPEQGWAVGAYGTLLRTANGGRNWADWSHHVGNPDELHLNGVVGDGAGTLYLASEWGMVFVSTNAGESWRVAETGYDGSFFGVVSNPETGSVFAYGLLGTIYRSEDQGVNWSAVDGLVRGSLFGAEAVAGSVVFVGQGGIATLTRDDGRTFTPMVQPDRDGLFGVATMSDGRFVASGERGARLLVVTAAGDQGDE
ncbi:WD40/YVTN/BNR-like repeat-containing protein [Pseudohalioglobus lutimaris]|nr:YCF48-related protein [Pseudohalioglobus lutimaris]